MRVQSTSSVERAVGAGPPQPPPNWCAPWRAADTACAAPASAAAPPAAAAARIGSCKGGGTQGRCLARGCTCGTAAALPAASPTAATSPHHCGEPASLLSPAGSPSHASTCSACSNVGRQGSRAVRQAGRYAASTQLHSGKQEPPSSSRLSSPRPHPRPPRSPAALRRGRPEAAGGRQTLARRPAHQERAPSDTSPRAPQSPVIVIERRFVSAGCRAGAARGRAVRPKAHSPAGRAPARLLQSTAGPGGRCSRTGPRCA